MKKSMLTGLIAIAMCLTTQSCLTTKTNVGKYKEQIGTEYNYAKAKQVWFLWGIFPLGRTSVATPSDGNCQVITKFNFVDQLVNGLTGGIVIMETIKVKAKREEIKK